MGFLDKTGLTERTATAGLTGRKLHWLITAMAVTGFSLFGYDQGLMSGIITGTKFNEEFPPTAGTDSHAAVIQGAVVSSYEIGCLFGAIFAMFRGDRIGRRPLIIVGCFIIVIGTIISITCFKPHWQLGQFVVGRVITGIGNGLNTATIPVWQSEMSAAHKRGQLVCLEGSVVAVGTMIAYWLDFGMSYVDNTAQWRVPISIQAVFALIVFFVIQFLPESPRWLIGHGREQEATIVLAALHADSLDSDVVQADVRIIKDAVDQLNGKAGYKELLTNGPSQHFRRMVLGATTQFFQQFTGCNAAIYYSTVLFENSIGLEKRLSLILGGVFATVYAISTIPCFFLVEKLGRRKLFMLGATGQGISFTITFACLIPDTTEASKGAAFGLYLFIVFFGFTILQLPWVYPPEVNPLATRTSATSVSTATNWISNFAVVMFTPIFVTNTRWGCYLFFAIMNFLFVPIIYFYYPETAGRSLEEVDIIFAKAYQENKAAFKVADELPKLEYHEIEREAEKHGLRETSGSDEEKEVGAPVDPAATTPADVTRSHSA